METHKGLPKEFRKYKFLDFFDVTNRMSIMNLFPSNDRCGIYVLYFKNGEYYIGKSLDIAVRYTQHSKTHKD